MTSLTDETRWLGGDLLSMRSDKYQILTLSDTLLTRHMLHRNVKIIKDRYNLPIYSSGLGLCADEESFSVYGWSKSRVALKLTQKTSFTSKSAFV